VRAGKREGKQSSAYFTSTPALGRALSFILDRREENIFSLVTFEEKAALNMAKQGSSALAFCFLFFSPPPSTSTLTWNRLRAFLCKPRRKFEKGSMRGRRRKLHDEEGLLRRQHKLVSKLICWRRTRALCVGEGNYVS
jgi:hypothetical protein